MSTVPKRKCVLLCAVAILAGCAQKTPDQIEAEKRKADEAWQAQVAVAERARQQDEDRLVRAQVAENARDAQSEDERAAQEADSRRRRAQEQLLDVLRGRLVDGAGARFTDVRWNSTEDALCGEVSEPVPGGANGEPRRFIVGNGEAAIEHGQGGDRFAELAQQIDCMH